jgi:F-type H+-transporting ATPase subunit a
MIVNLFSSFDPSSSLSIPLNWVSSILFLILISSPFWIVPSRSNLIFKIILENLHKEFFILIKNPLNLGITLTFSSLFLLVIINNFLGLFPFIFTATRHLTITLSISLPLWLAFMLYGWINNTQHIFAHLLPLGTPPVLIPFIVCIETIRNVIRPGTLAVRLSANIIAGHLILTLLGNTGSSLSSIILFVLITIQILLLTLEAAVAIIQSYVISILLTLYSSEVN